MKTVGLLGGMSSHSSRMYQDKLDHGVNEALGGLHSASIILRAYNFAEIAELQHANKWPELAHKLSIDAMNLESAGSDFIALCTNTMHKVASHIEEVLSIPFLHIADPTAEAIQEAGIQTIGLLGTAFTMEENFYKGRLTDNFGLEVIVPDEQERKIVHDVIYQELCHGDIQEDSRRSYNEIITNLMNRGAQGVILGCTEIGLLVKPEDSPIQVFDTTELHVQAILKKMLS